VRVFDVLTEQVDVSVALRVFCHGDAVHWGDVNHFEFDSVSGCFFSVPREGVGIHAIDCGVKMGDAMAR